MWKGTLPPQDGPHPASLHQRVHLHSQGLPGSGLLPGPRGLGRSMLILADLREEVQEHPASVLLWGELRPCRRTYECDLIWILGVCR